MASGQLEGGAGCVESSPLNESSSHGYEMANSRINAENLGATLRRVLPGPCTPWIRWRQYRRTGAVHSHCDQPRAEMTRRFLRACENPHVHIIGHPTARRLGKRPPVDVDLAELFRACAATGTALEINSHPQRLDLPSDHIKAARD